MSGSPGHARLWIGAIVLGLMALVPMLSAGTAKAHPLGNFTINRYARVELYRGVVRVEYVLDVAEIPTFQALPDIDADGDGVESPDELASYAQREAERHEKSLELDIDGQRVRLQPLAADAALADGQGGLQVLRMAFVYDAPSGESTRAVPVRFVDHNYEGRPGWREIVVRPSEGSVATVAPDLEIERSAGLQSYPSETLKSAPSMQEAMFSWAPRTGSQAPAIEGRVLAPAAQRAGGGFAGIFDDLLRHDRSGLFILFSLVVAFLFGAQHALGPGHGKTMVAAYLVGSRGTPRQAALLGATVTATHTSTVYLLGLVTLVAAEFIAPDTVYLWMGVISGALVVGFGAALFVARAWSAIGHRPSAVAGTHRHGIFGRVHSHGPQEELHDHDGHEHPHRTGDEPRVGMRSLLSLGVLGGLLPCPSAVVVMVAAISQGQVLLGMALIVAFSLGLAVVLTAIGMSLVLGKRLGAGRRVFQRRSVQRLLAVMPVLSALVVMLVGVGITYQAWNQPGL